MKHRVIEDALAYYRLHYQGLTRGEVRQKDPSLYQLLRTRKQLRKIPLRR